MAIAIAPIFAVRQSDGTARVETLAALLEAAEALFRDSIAAEQFTQSS